MAVMVLFEQAMLGAMSKFSIISYSMRIMISAVKNRNSRRIKYNTMFLFL